MLRLLTWSFIPIFVRRLIQRGFREEIEQLDIVSRLRKELELSKRINFKKYSIRKASKVKLAVFSDTLTTLADWVNGAHTTIIENGYASDKWKTTKRNYGSLMLDEYFSENGHDVHPENLVRSILPKLGVICDCLEEIKNQENKPRRIYHLRQFKPVLEDSIELLSHLRAEFL
jgi:hypothetical protein